MSLTAITTDTGVMLSNAKWCFSARRVEQSDARSLRSDFEHTRAGDLILGRVLEIGQHKGIQLKTGRRSELFPGDLVVLPAGARYAPDQFEGTADIDPNGTDMLAGGGCLGTMRARNERMKLPTRVMPLGRLATIEGRPINIEDYALPPASSGHPTIPVIAVLGTAMNSGKTLATARLGYGLRQAGLRVATIKGTGTGSFGDYNEYLDTGVHFIADFTDAGMATTYLEPLERVKDGIYRLIAAAEEAGSDLVVMEIADGLLQRESAALLADPDVRNLISGLVFACGDAVAAVGGVSELRRRGYEPDVLTGKLSCSPMASSEAESATGVRVLGKDDLADPSEAMSLLRDVRTERMAGVL